MARLEAEGIDGARGKLASVGINESIVPTVEDWDEFYRFIHRNKGYHLLERRAAAGAYRELLEQRKGKPVPGVVPFKKRTLSLRTV
jgi:predicted metal-binding protein